MDPGAPTSSQSLVDVARATLRFLAQRRLEPTPDNYARAWAEQAGSGRRMSVEPAGPPDAMVRGGDWADLIESLLSNLHRSGPRWTADRRRQGLARVFRSSRDDVALLQRRLQALARLWESDGPMAAVAAAQAGGHDPSRDAALEGAASAESGTAPLRVAPTDPDWTRIAAALTRVCTAALPAEDERASRMVVRLRALCEELVHPETVALPVAEVEALCAEAASWLGHRHLIVAELQSLCREMSAGLVELAEDDRWTRGQCAALQASLGSGLSLLALRAAGQMLDRTRAQQSHLRAERNAARDALKQLLARMLDEVGTLGAHAGVFELAVTRHAEVVASADSVEILASVVQSMLEDSRQVRRAVSGARQRMQEQQMRAHELEDRVRALEAELRELSDQVVTDTLTQVANRRGLEQAFEIEVARSRRSTGSAAALAVALIDIDNFKQLNDRLGHVAGDRTLRSLAAAIRGRLRPVDHVARYGGEEFVVLLPGTPVQAAQQALLRLQRSLSAALFMHEGEEVFITFSAGVTLWREGESLEATLSRADEALYEAKRSGKNRTCIG